MWPLPEEMVVEATGDTRAIPILWGPTIFYYCNILVQFSMVFGLIGWMAYSYFTEGEERRRDEQGRDSGDSKQDAKEKGNDEKSSAEKATAEPKDKDNVCAKAAAEATDLLNGDQPRAQATVSDEALLKRKTSDEARKNSSEEQLAQPRNDLTASARKTPRTGRSMERLLKDTATQSAETSESELDSELGDTPGMAVRRRRSKRLLAGDSATNTNITVAGAQ